MQYTISFFIPNSQSPEYPPAGPLKLVHGGSLSCGSTSGVRTLWNKHRESCSAAPHTDPLRYRGHASHVHTTNHSQNRRSVHREGLTWGSHIKAEIGGDFEFLIPWTRDQFHFPDKLRFTNWGKGGVSN